jgi:hypothetical protein
MRKLQPNHNEGLTSTCPFCGKLCGEIYSSSTRRSLGPMQHNCQHFKSINTNGQFRFMSDDEIQHYTQLGQGFTLTSDDIILVNGKPVNEFKG